MRKERPPLALRLIFLGKHLSHLLEQRLANRGLNRTQSVVLTVLNHHPGLQAQDLRVPASVEPANVTRTLQSLERLGLLERRPHPTDGRASLLFLTEAGRTLARELSEEIQGLSTALLRGMDPQELSHLESVLDLLVQNVRAELSVLGCRHPVSEAQEPSAEETRLNPEGTPADNGLKADR